LIQYEIYSKLLSRSSNKKQKVVIQQPEDELDDLELNELEKIAKTEVKVKAQRIWVGYCKGVVGINQKNLKLARRGLNNYGFQYKMYKKGFTNNIAIYSIL